MSIYHTPPQRCLTESARISRDLDEFLSAGGEIEQIPIGQSAHNLEVKALEGRGTRVAWQDDSNHWTSDIAKAASVRKREIKESEKKARKRNAR